MCVLRKHRSCPSIQKGTVTMEHNIIIHDDCCTNMSSEAIREILSAVTDLITEAVLRTAEEPDRLDMAA